MKISIRGPIVSSNQHRFYQWYGMEATSPKSVADALAKGNGERAEVEINSGAARSSPQARSTPPCAATQAA